VPAGTEGVDWVKEGNKYFTTRELDNMGHGKGRDANVAEKYPGDPNASLAGKSAHDNLSRAAKSNFDTGRGGVAVTSWSHLMADQKMKIIRWMDEHPNQIPENGELREAKAK
jgi:hypothetical protein